MWLVVHDLFPSPLWSPIQRKIRALFPHLLQQACQGPAWYLGRGKQEGRRWRLGRTKEAGTGKEAGIEEGGGGGGGDIGIEKGKRLRGEGGRLRSAEGRAEAGWCGHAYVSPGSLLLSPDSKPLRTGTYLAFLFVSLDVYKVRVLLLQPNMGVKEEVVCDPPTGTACQGPCYPSEEQ